MRQRFLLLFCLVLFGAGMVKAQPKHEFRGAWIATVANLDWPSSPFSHPDVQRNQLVSMLDDLKAAGINAVFFQVRTESDALYASELEPWSYWLTGSQGEAPDPFYDPLELAIEEAHKRGMELHAWFNPYRVDRGSGYTKAETHVSQTHPEWLLEFGNVKILDPGQPDVRDYIATVISDVVRRYDVDGIHFDDYFYPYPPNTISNEDNDTFEAHNRGFTNRGDWRRDNVDLFVQQIADSIDALKPHVKYGISPFGIWKNGVPSGIVGMDAYNVIYADATAWLDDQMVDYIAPQLYWKFGGGQDFAKLATWWAGTAFGVRHVYTGHGLYRSDRATFSNTLFAADEVPRQVRYTRGIDNIQGSIFFRAKNITTFTSKGFEDSLKTNLYRYPALTPPMAWKSQVAPEAASNLAYTWDGDGDTVTLTWDASAGENTPQAYAIYRILSDGEPDLTAATLDARNLLAVTGETSYTDLPGANELKWYYAVTAVSDNSIESAPSNVVSLEGRAVAREPGEQPTAFHLEQNYPNPFNPTTEIRFQLDRAGDVRLEVYNLLGQRVATLVDGRSMTSGLHAVQWDATDDAGRAVASGTYIYQLRFDGRMASKTMVLLK